MHFYKRIQMNANRYWGIVSVLREFFYRYHKPSLILQAFFFFNGANLNLEINGNRKGEPVGLNAVDVRSGRNIV